MPTIKDWSHSLFLPTTCYTVWLTHASIHLSLTWTGFVIFTQKKRHF